MDLKKYMYRRHLRSIRTIDKNKNNTIIEYNKIAELYEQLGNNEKSNEYYEKANEIEVIQNYIFTFLCKTR